MQKVPDEILKNASKELTKAEKDLENLLDNYGFLAEKAEFNKLRKRLAKIKKANEQLKQFTNL